MALILVIDDDAAIRTVFDRILHKAGYSVICADNGRKGLKLLESESPDIVVCDIIMPDMDGLEVLMSIRKMSRGIPVIAVSGGPQAIPMDFLPMAKSLGACKILYKPIEVAELLSAVQEALFAHQKSA